MQDSREEDEELWRKIQDANTPSRAEMARAEMELQAIEPDPTFTVDSSRLVSGAGTAKWRQRQGLLAACAAILLMSVLAIAFANRPTGGTTRHLTIEQCLDMIDMPATYTGARLSVAPVANTCLRCARLIVALSRHPSPAVATAATKAMDNLRAGTPRPGTARMTDYVDAVKLAKNDKADDADLIAAIADLETVGGVCMQALQLFEALPDSDAEMNVAHALSKLDSILHPKD